MHSFNQKIRTLKKLLKEQSEYLHTCIGFELVIQKKRVIIIKKSVLGENRDTNIKFPKKHIDRIIANERAKNYIYNKSKDIDEAIKEIESIDRIKNIIK